MSQNIPQPMEEAAALGSTACQNCHSTMPLGLRFCRNCGFRLGEGVAEYTETMRFPSGNATTDANSFGMTGGQIATVDSAACARRKKRMSGMTWIFLAMIVFFLTAGIVSQFIRPARRLAGSIGVSGPAAPAPPRSRFGINSFDTTDGGVTFASVVAPDSPADKAGMVGGDIITSFDGHAVTTDDEMTELMEQTPIGKTVDVVYIRDGETKTTKLTTVSESELDRLTKVFVDRPQGLGKLGINDQEEVVIPNSTLRGVQVGKVERSMPADMAGLKEGDIIIQMGPIPIRTEEELSQRIKRAIPYEVIDVVVMRGAEKVSIPVKMGRR